MEIWTQVGLGLIIKGRHTHPGERRRGPGPAVLRGNEERTGGRHQRPSEAMISKRWWLLNARCGRAGTRRTNDKANLGENLRR